MKSAIFGQFDNFRSGVLEDDHDQQKAGYDEADFNGFHRSAPQFRASETVAASAAAISAASSGIGTATGSSLFSAIARP